MPQLAPRVAPLEAELAGGLGDAAAPGGPADAPPVEAQSARERLVAHGAQISRDAGARRGLAQEAHELRMCAVAARAPGEHRLREQGLTPEGTQAAVSR